MSDNSQTRKVSTTRIIRRVEEAVVKKFAGGFSLDSGHW
jgi:hypothetical protein